MKTPKGRILVVEDDPALLRGLIDVLVYNGYQVEGADDGGLGLAAGLQETFDLILLDVMLPTLDGFSVCKEIRKKKPDQGIIIITAKGAEDDVVTGFHAGADDYISKPFSLREVMVRIEAVLRRSGKNPGDAEGSISRSSHRAHPQRNGYYRVFASLPRPDHFQKGIAHRGMAICRR